MIELDVQLKHGKLVPFSKEAGDMLKNYYENQILKARVSGIRKERSVVQLRLFWACCRCVADNTTDTQWNTPEKVSIQIKLALQFYESVIVTPSGDIHFELGSISFKNLSQVEANKVFDRSWPIMAKKIGITVDELLKEN